MVSSTVPREGFSPIFLIGSTFFQSVSTKNEAAAKISLSHPVPTITEVRLFYHGARYGNIYMQKRLSCGAPLENGKLYQDDGSAC